MIKSVKNAIVVVIVLAGLLGGGYVLYESMKKTPIAPAAKMVEIAPQENVQAQLDDILNVLLTLHYVSLTEISQSNPDAVIVNELQESMNDLNKLEKLSFQTESLSQSKNELIATIGLVLKSSVIGLTGAYKQWILYLRSVDVNTVQVSEFQYQLALFQTSTHDAYLSLLENASLLPMIVVQFSADGVGENNTVDEDLKKYFLAQIEQKFSDILLDNDRYYKETKNRYAIAVLIQGYKDFLTKSDQ